MLLEEETMAGVGSAAARGWFGVEGNGVWQVDGQLLEWTNDVVG